MLKGLHIPIANKNLILTGSSEIFDQLKRYIGKLVGLWTGLHKKYQTDFHENWMKDGF